MENFLIREQSGFAATRSASCFGGKVSLNASCRFSRQDTEMENFPVEELYSPMEVIRMRKKSKVILVFVFIIAVPIVFSVSLWIQNQKPQVELGLVNGRFQELSNKPNGVSTQTSYADKKIPSLPFKGTLKQTHDAIIAALLAYPGIEIITNESDYIYAIATTEKMKFHDDIEIFFDEATSEVHYRSASRAGYSDGGLNRKRYEDIAKNYTN